jgi:hypothetical protein
MAEREENERVVLKDVCMVDERVVRLVGLKVVLLALNKAAQKENSFWPDLKV